MTLIDPTKVARENVELHEEVDRLQREHYHFVRALNVISKMPNEAADVATKALQLRPFNV